MKKLDFGKKNKRGTFRVFYVGCFLFLLSGCFSLLTGCSFGKTGQSTAQYGTSVLFEKKDSDSTKRNMEGVKIYGLNEEQTKLVSQEYQLSGETLEEQVEELLTELEKILWSEDDKADWSEKTLIQEFKINDSKVLTLYLTPDYVSSGNTTAVLRRAAIVKTLCQLEQIDSVELYLGSQPMMLANGKPMGLLKAEDFIDSTGASTEFLQETQIVVYFASSDGKHLLDSSLKVTYDGKLSTQHLILNQLMTDAVPEGMSAVIPEGTELNKVSVKDGICYVDFNENFLEGREGVLPEVTIYAIVNSLTELSNVYKVQFLIDGKSEKNYKNLDIDFSSVFERNLDIVEGEQ